MNNDNIKKSVLSIPITFEKTEEIENADNRFTRVKIFLMHTGLNLNNSYFEKSVVDEALPTLGYISINGFIEDNSLDEKDFSDHRHIITKDENGVRRKYIGNAYGVVMSAADNNAHYENRMCDDGVMREFLVVDGLIWNCFEDSKDILERDVIKNQSMELDESSVDGYEDENGVFHFTRFSFKAACILGVDYQPAMMNSTIEVQFSVSDFVKSIQEELNDKIMTFTRLVKQEQGGIETMPKTDFLQTVLEQFSDISNMVNQYEVMENLWGESIPRYYLKDIQDSEVIVVDRKNSYQMYGFPFTMNGDKAEIDFTNGNRVKTTYVKYDEGDAETDGAFDFGQHIADIENNAFNKVTEAESKITEVEQKLNEAEEARVTAETNYTELKSEYDAIKSEYDAIKPKYDTYVLAEQERINAEIEALKDAEFAKYESVLADNAEFVALKEKKSDMTVKEIESECAILYARKNLATTNFSKSNSQPLQLGVMNDNDDEFNDYVETKYGSIHIKH